MQTKLFNNQSPKTGMLQHFQPALQSLPLISMGKVRENYSIDEQHMLMLTTDRVSAFDVILDQTVACKGKVLNQMSLFWFDFLKHIVPNHLTTINAASVVANHEVQAVTQRGVVVKKLKPILVEAVVRGYLAGSGWQDYQQTQSVCGIELPAGLQNAQQLNEPIFTPAAKAQVGDHDENISFKKMVELIGENLAEQIKVVSLQLYKEAQNYAFTKGILIADTKFEFGLDENNQLVLMDEILTPDSSRFWDMQTYKVGGAQPSYDKQLLRDWLANKAWDKTYPAPQVDANILEQTKIIYEKALYLIAGKTL